MPAPLPNTAANPIRALPSPPFFSRPRLVACIAAGVFFILIFPQIGAGTLWHWDELLAAERSREMLARGNPFTVTLNFSPDLRKPPLQYWADALLLALFPPYREFDVRLPTALYAAFTILAAAWVARRCFPEEPDLPAWVALALLVCGLFIHNASIGLLDEGAAFYLILAIGGCLLARRDPRWWWFVALQATLGAWQKAPFALAAWAVILLYRCARAARGERGEAPLLSLHLAGALLTALLCAGAWPLWQWLRYGLTPLHAAVQSQTADLLRPHIGDHGFRPYLYAWWLARDWALPGLCTPLAVLASLLSWPSGSTGIARQNVELAWVCVAFAVGLAALPYRNEHYLIVIVPVLALLCVRWMRILVWRLPFPVLTRGIILAAILLTSAPAAAINYAARAPATRVELKAAARELGHNQKREEEVLVDTTIAGDFNTGVFILFYARLIQPVTFIRYERLPQAPINRTAGEPDFPCRGICRPEDVPRLQLRFTSITLGPRHGGFLCWYHTGSDAPPRNPRPGTVFPD